MSEQWLPIPGYEGKYEVSDLGRVRSVGRRLRVLQRLRNGETREIVRRYKPCTLRPGIASNGYPTVALQGVTHCVHALVTSAFLGARPDGLVVCHWNGDRTDARLANLRYDTPAANVADTDRHGRRTRGSQYSSAKLNERTARWARDMRGRVTQSKLAEILGVSPAAIQAVHDGRTWRHV